MPERKSKEEAMKKLTKLMFALAFLVGLGAVVAYSDTPTIGGQQLFTDGTATEPSIAFANETTLGLRRSAAGVVDLAGGTFTDGSLSANVALLNGTAAFTADQTVPTLVITATTFAGLGTPANGTFKYCSDCTTAATCAGAGTGALAKRLNAVWVCN